jgi:23S rRNA pseudouridine2605 synthase
VYLSKFLALSGICSRRKSTEVIKLGLVMVNDRVVKEPFHDVKPGDIVYFDGQIVKQERKFVYILLNKPENCISTVSDEHARRTVFDIVKLKSNVRLYPVGRLDRMTTGLLILTNDGQLTKKLTHPSHEVPKKYEVLLDRVFQRSDMQKLCRGIRLHDGFIKPDRIFCPSGEHGCTVIVELHSGRNRIVRRMFEHLGYEVKELDRFFYAGLTKKGLKLGQWRYLTEKEVEGLRTTRSNPSTSSGRAGSSVSSKLN